ncbi:RNA-binding S4 domain-containing protein [Rhodococcus sp. NPDC058505]|uniref:RNA-binding S4 domain-containing protein n=1 Tax=unclassified Rhodococcus (in: high G+C Gram-positive bacteria) TaxID=192944 RepID=UPI00365BAAAD
MSDSSGVRLDSWVWSVRLFKTRSAAAAACRSGHVRVNGSSAKPAQLVRVDDEIRMRVGGRERIVVVARLIRKRVGAPEAALCLIDRSPPPPPREVLLAVPQRDRGTGRPTKRERRELDRLRGFNED